MGLQMLLPALLLTIIAAVSCHGAEAYDYGYAQACTAAQYMPLSGSTNNNCQQLQPALSELVLCRNARIVNLFVRIALSPSATQLMACISLTSWQYSAAATCIAQAHCTSCPRVA